MLLFSGRDEFETGIFTWKYWQLWFYLMDAIILLSSRCFLRPLSWSRVWMHPRSWIFVLWNAGGCSRFLWRLVIRSLRDLFIGALQCWPFSRQRGVLLPNKWQQRYIFRYTIYSNDRSLYYVRYNASIDFDPRGGGWGRKAPSIQSLFPTYTLIGTIQKQQQQQYSHISCIYSFFLFITYVYFSKHIEYRVSFK